jgi:hypothetical protein
VDSRIPAGVVGLKITAGEKVRLHDFRYSCAGIVFNLGTVLPRVPAVLRLQPRVTLMMYAGLLESEWRPCETS